MVILGKDFNYLIIIKIIFLLKDFYKLILKTNSNEFLIITNYLNLIKIQFKLPSHPLKSLKKYL